MALKVETRGATSTSAPVQFRTLAAACWLLVCAASAANVFLGGPLLGSVAVGLAGVCVAALLRGRVCVAAAAIALGVSGLGVVAGGSTLAVCAVLLSAGLLVARARPQVAQLLSLVAGVGALGALVGRRGMSLMSAAIVVAAAFGVWFATSGQGFMRVVSSDSAGGRLLRRLLPQSMAGPVVLGGFVFAGYRFGLYDGAIGLGLLVLTVSVSSSVQLLRSGHYLHRVDGLRIDAELALRHLNHELEARVEERTSELEDSEARYRTLVDLLPSGVVVVVEGVVVFANHAIVRLIGMPIIGKRAEDVLRLGEVTHDEFDLRRIDGTTVRVEVNITAITYDRRQAALAVLNDVTERHIAAESSARLAAIVESTDDAIFATSPDGTVLSWNPGAERTFGYWAHEIVGGPVEVLVPPDLHEELRAVLARVARGERIRHLDTVRSHKDGTRIDVALTVSPIQDEEGVVVGSTTTCRDITRRKRHERLLEEANAELHRRARDENLLRQASASVAAATDLDAALCALSESARHVTMFEWAHLCVVDREAMESVSSCGTSGRRGPAGDRFAIHEKFQAGVPVVCDDTLSDDDDALATQMLERGVRSFVAVGLAAGGGVHAAVMFTSARPLAFSGGDVEVLDAMVKDAGGSFNTLLLLDREKEASRRLVELDQLKNEFVGIVAHDLRSPMTVVGGYADLLQRRWDRLADEERLSFVARIQESIGRLGDLVGDVLEVARIESGEVPLEIRTFDLRDLVERTVAEMTSVHPVPGCALAFGGSSFAVFGDEDRTWRVLTNFLSNSFKFSPDDAPVVVSVSNADGFVHVSVRDRGPGIEPDALPKLFQKFSRIKQLGPKVKGTGLGLYICKSLVEGQGGKIWAESVVGEGSVFHFTIPVAA